MGRQFLNISGLSKRKDLAIRDVRERARYSFDYGELARYTHTIGMYNSVSQGIVCAKKLWSMDR